MDWYDHRFEGVVEQHVVGRSRPIRYTVLFLPDALASGLPFDRHPQLRIEGEVNDVPVSGAFVSAGDGRYYLMLSPELLRNAGLAVGMPIEMRFRIADQEAIDVPDDLRSALAGHEAAAAAWAELTTGRRRALAHHVATAKGAATRARRIAALLVAISGEPDDEARAEDVARLRYPLGAQYRGPK